jgi:glucose-1-phosphate cytidylyltransferase
VKVVILCGGKGMRLREETEYRPKPLVLVGDKPILWHIMKIYSHYGYRDFVLALGYKGEMIKNYFLNFDELHNNFTLKLGQGNKEITYHNKQGADNWNISFVDTGQEAGTGSRIKKIMPYLGGDERFLLTYGDAVANVNIPELVRYHNTHGKIATVSGVRQPQTFGVLEIEGVLAKTFMEKPTHDGYVNGGFFVCEKKVFDYIPDDTLCMFEEEPLRALARENQLAVYRHDNFWHCVDTFKHMEGLNALYTKGKRDWMVWES